mmetsp:Transcript_6166/g.18627  ORF Transcript_6166/g.18627 Transcript_6166/m.18627 type:complete len:373 (+) Transcript_6166:59-1177(+)|eukprot:CAMPEP_0198731662 /NCGR_PEP_ID=MMETSP1475-20131203/31253_1 /TAXON_ID= ORGANISM="Unidentified sp., Strain CCMP1999" /NCGR_SAMPLE_ID=MMETSP1475 /ASSEMBLY_ACC=CAM_ASM_001111 /LENGTH=372 /DNA_ID=CAMNT_0044494655 /DNA_START=42 /DNA_END=1160 /DNA_ORIENTATION=-
MASAGFVAGGGGCCSGVRWRGRAVCSLARNGADCPDPIRRLKSVAVVRDEASGATVYLIGCVHGFQSSKSDVETVFNSVSPPPSVVNLELCESRWNVVRKERPKSQSNQKKGRGLNFSILEKAFGGKGPALLSVALSSVSGVQKLLGFDPGVEFKVAGKLASKYGAKVVLGDKSAMETTRRLYESISPFLVVRRPLYCLRKLMPSMPPKNGINYLATLSDPKRLFELLLFTVPIGGCTNLFSQAISMIGKSFWGNVNDHTLAKAATVNTFETGVEEVLSLGVLCLLASWWVAFRQVIIDERNEVLYQSLVSIFDNLPRSGSPQRDTTVVAVYGMFHINGVVNLLNERNASVLRTAEPIDATLSTNEAVDVVP